MPSRASRSALPTIRAFRALRYEPEAVGDVGLVVSPPYDVISPREHARLLARHQKNAVRLDLPAQLPGDAPDERYRRAARTFAEWRSDGTFHKDPRAAVYVYEQTYRLPGTAVERTQRGFFARLWLEPLADGSGVLPHERTMAAPKEDRYKLLRATGANMSPVVGLYRESTGRTAALLASIATRPPAVAVRDDGSVEHRRWVLPQGDSAVGRGPVAPSSKRDGRRSGRCCLPAVRPCGIWT